MHRIPVYFTVSKETCESIRRGEVYVDLSAGIKEEVFIIYILFNFRAETIKRSTNNLIPSASDSTFHPKIPLNPINVRWCDLSRHNHNKYIKKTDSKEKLKEKKKKKTPPKVTPVSCENSKLSAGVECRLDLLGFILTPTLHCSMSHHCQPWKLTFYGLGRRRSAWRDGDQWLAECCDSEEESSAPLDSLSQLAPPAAISHFVRKQGERKGMAVLSLIGFDFGGTQLPADRTFFPAQDSAPPAGAAEMMLCTHNGGCRRTSQWELPTAKHQGPNRQLVLHHMSVMGCPNSKSVDPLTTIAYWKSLLLWLEEDIFSFLLLSCAFFPTLTCSSSETKQSATVAFDQILFEGFKPKEEIITDWRLKVEKTIWRNI